MNFIFQWNWSTLLNSKWFIEYPNPLPEKVKVVQLCPTLCDPMDYTAHGILQARVLEWVPFSFSRGSPNPGITPGLLYHRWILHLLSHKGSPRILQWEAYPFYSRSSQPRNQTGVSCIAGGYFYQLSYQGCLFIALARFAHTHSHSSQISKCLFLGYFHYRMGPFSNSDRSHKNCI